MAEAIAEAERSIAQGGLPIGAVLTRDNKIVARGHNNRVQEKNVILHGEMSCLRDAGVISFHDTVMYTTLSPCSMCAGALGLFKVSLVVIGESRVAEQLDKALTRAEKSIEKEIDADAKELERELKEAEKESIAG